jgi:hypothetical protein
MVKDTAAIASYAEALHHFLTARALAGTQTGASSKTRPADRALELQIRTVLTKLDHLRHRHKMEPIDAIRWAEMRSELEHVYWTMTEATS